MLTGLSQLSVSSVPRGLQLAPYCDGTRARRPRGSQLNYKLAPRGNYDIPTSRLTGVRSASELPRHIGRLGVSASRANHRYFRIALLGDSSGDRTHIFTVRA